MKFFTTSRISENILVTPEGYLVCQGVAIGRTGDMIYGAGETPIEPGEDGKVIVTREADELFRKETIASFEGKSFTIFHPDEFVTPDNWKELTVGVIQNVRQGTDENANDLIADLLVTDKEAIELIQSGLREVSCGYEAEYVQTGIGKGVQKNIVGNHLALVSEGRAGSSYAINDHKGAKKMKLGDKIKAIFAKAQDEAMKVADEENPKEEKKEKAPGYDDLMKAVKDLGEKVSALKPKDASTEETQNSPAEVKAKDDDVKESSIEARLSKLEGMVAKLLGASGDEKSEEKEEMKDDDMGEEGEESLDEKCATGDEASRLEIIAPGTKGNGKDAKAKALKTLYATTDGKKLVDEFTNGEEPDYKNEALIDTLFVGVSEVLKAQRGFELGNAKEKIITQDFASVFAPKGAMTAEKINEMNAKRYAQK